jgi:hypothetical protein
MLKKGAFLMGKIALLALGAVFAAATPAIAGHRLSGEAELAKALEGRIAGKPVDCIQLSDARSTRIFDHTAIVYDTGSVLYVNRPRAGTESLDQWDALVTRTSTSELCSVDTVQLFDTGARMQRGTVFLGEFVPYRRVRTADAH